LHEYCTIQYIPGVWSWTCGSWIYIYLCNQCLPTLKLWVRILFMARCTRYNIMWSSLSVFSSNKTDLHDITEILLKVALKHHQTKLQYIPLHDCCVGKNSSTNMIELLGYGSFMALSTIFQLYFTDIRKPVSEWVIVVQHQWRNSYIMVGTSCISMRWW
jgi:hypothetical protein